MSENNPAPKPAPEKEQKSFWTTLPGILTAFAAVITAITALVTALSAAGVIGPGTPTPTPTLVVAPGTMALKCVVDSTLINQGQTTQVNVLAIGTNNAPVASANIRIDANGGTFETTSNTTVVGATDSQGVFKATWRAPKPANENYTFSLQASKQGFANANTDCRVTVR